MFCDCHFHLAECAKKINGFDLFAFSKDYMGCTCAHNVDEFLFMEKTAFKLKEQGCFIGLAFGLHPQNPSIQNLSFLENLLKEGRVCAVGETGHDYFTPEFKNLSAKQKEAYTESLRLSALYKVPVIVHNRKALDEIFASVRLLKAVPAVVFHSFAYGMREALSLRAKGITCYFSFGKPLLKGAKRALDCVQNLPLDCLLLETDAPFQTLKGEAFTNPADIAKVYEAVCAVRGIPLSKLEDAVAKNFCKVFCPS